MRLPIPSSTTLLAWAGDALETATAVLGSCTAFVDDLAKVADTRGRQEHDQRPAKDDRYYAGYADGLAGRQIGCEQAAVGAGRPRLSVVPDPTPAVGGGSA